MEGQVVITHQINVHQPPERKKYAKPKLVIGSDEHKAFIYGKTLGLTLEDKRYQPGEEWAVKGHTGEGVVLDFADFFTSEWEGLKVKFIEMWMYGENQSILCHPSDLKEIK